MKRTGRRFNNLRNLVLPIVAFVGLLVGLMPLSSAEDHEKPAAVGQTVIVYDLSGSMDLEIDGTAKSAAVKEGLFSNLGTLDHLERTGLVAFGHRSRSSCSDLQVAVTLDEIKTSSIKIRNFLGLASPLGRAPIAAALRLAGSQLEVGKPNQSLVLIADGSDSCQENPCEVVDRLFDQGVGFKGYVVGVGMTPGQFGTLRCVADKSGGHAINARNPQEIGEALAAIFSIINREAESFSESPLRKALARKTEANVVISTELEETQSLLVDEQKLRASAENALSASLTREQELVRTLTKVKTDRASLTTNLSEAERRISNLQAEKRQGEEELAQSNENLMKTQNHVEQLEALIVDLREETVNRRLAFEELAEEKKRFDEENAQTISDLRSQNQTLVSILKLNQKKFDSQAAKSRAMIKWAEKDRDVYQEEGVQLRGEIQVLNEAIEGLEEQLSLSEDKLVISRNKLEREKTHSAALTDQISFLEEEQKRIQNRLLTALTSLQNSLKVSESLMHLLPESVGEEESNSTSVADFCEKYEGLFSLEQLSNLGC